MIFKFYKELCVASAYETLQEWVVLYFGYNLQKRFRFSPTKNPLEKLISAIAFHIHYTIRNYLKNKRNEIRLTYKIPNWVSNEM